MAGDYDPAWEAKQRACLCGITGAPAGNYATREHAPGCPQAAPSPPQGDPDDTAALLAAAEQAVRATLAEGKAKYAPGHWLTVGALDHVGHALSHVDQAYNGRPSDKPNLEEIRHAICRLSMALALLEKP